MAVDFSKFVKYEHPQKKPDSYHTSDIRVVTSVNVSMPKNTDSLPEEMVVVMEQELNIGVPVQIQFEIIPVLQGYSNGFYTYCCTVNAIKSRIKPGNAEFDQAEEEILNEIIEEPPEKEVNRFTGLDL